MLQSKTLKQGR